MIKKRKNSEFQYQKMFFTCLKYKYPKIYSLAFAIPNGGSRHILEAYNLKLSGVKAGVPDIFIAYPSNGFHGLFIEMKAGKNKVSDSQSNMLKLLSEAGYKCKICYTDIEAVTELDSYLLKGS